jgi:hypothetical protein
MKNAVNRMSIYEGMWGRERRKAYFVPLLLSQSIPYTLWDAFLNCESINEKNERINDIT